MEVIMRREFALAAALIGGTLQFLLSPAPSAQSTLDTGAIEQATGLKGQFIAAENVFKVTKPRTDVRVEIDGWTMPPFMGLGSWAAFTPAHGGVMMMGDTVLFEDEVNPVISAALAAGLEVTALHNHFFFDQPKVYFLHIGGTGDARALAAGVKTVYDTITEIRAARPLPAKAFGGEIAAPSSITPAPLESALGAKGQTNQGMVKVVLGRTTAMHGIPVGTEMGVNTWAAFAGSDEAAVVDGDFAMLEGELQPVLRAMRQEGINIVAVHQHMSQEQPRVLFLHYWGKGRAIDLAQSLKRVLDVQAAIKS
jgi:hypothetical protein